MNAPVHFNEALQALAETRTPIDDDPLRVRDWARKKLIRAIAKGQIREFDGLLNRVDLATWFRLETGHPAPWPCSIASSWDDGWRALRTPLEHALSDENQAFRVRIAELERRLSMLEKDLPELESLRAEKVKRKTAAKSKTEKPG